MRNTIFEQAIIGAKHIIGWDVWGIAMSGMINNIGECCHSVIINLSQIQLVSTSARKSQPNEMLLTMRIFLPLIATILVICEFCGTIGVVRVNQMHAIERENKSWSAHQTYRLCVQDRSATVFFFLFKSYCSKGFCSLWLCRLRFIILCNIRRQLSLRADR